MSGIAPVLALRRVGSPSMRAKRADSEVVPRWSLRPRQMLPPHRPERRVPVWLVVSLLLLHMALAPFEKGRPILVLLHGVTALGVALIYGTNPRYPLRTMQAVAYICGAEVLWRMCARTGALPWEFGKLAMIAILAVAILRSSRFRGSWLAILYIALLLPSAATTMIQMDLDSARQALSGTLAGPLAMALSLFFLSQVQLTQSQLVKIFFCFIVPLCGVAFLCYSGTFGAAEVAFGRTSNKGASGGFGPNQVSATLGFGILCALFWFLTEKGRPQVRVLLGLLMAWFAVQSALTFSRTGLYLTGLSVAIGVMPLLRNARARWTVLGLATLTFLLAYFLVVPWLDSFTGGALGDRFRNTNLTNRDKFWKAELQMWKAHPILGVGVGVSDSMRMEGDVGEVQAHTEYTRLLAEHGMLGLAAQTILLVCLHAALRRARCPYALAVCLAMVTFGLLFMVVSATRLALLALAFGLASASAVPERASRPAQRLTVQPSRPQWKTCSGFMLRWPVRS